MDSGTPKVRRHTHWAYLWRRSELSRGGPSRIGSALPAPRVTNLCQLSQGLPRGNQHQRTTGGMGHFAMGMENARPKGPRPYYWAIFPRSRDRQFLPWTGVFAFTPSCCRSRSSRRPPRRHRSRKTSCLHRRSPWCGSRRVWSQPGRMCGTRCQTGPLPGPTNLGDHWFPGLKGDFGHTKTVSQMV
jgi:hypothetical protein